MPRVEWNSPDSDLGCCEEIAQAPGLVSLCLDETILAFEVAGIVESGGEGFVLLSIVFETHGFCLEDLIEARANVVGFEVLVQRWQGSFLHFGGLRTKLLSIFADNTDRE